MHLRLWPIFFILFITTKVLSFEVTGYYGVAATDTGEMTLDRGVVESSTGSSSFFGLRFGPELFNGSIGVDLFYHSTTQTFSDKNSSLSSTKDFLGTYMNVYISYDFLPKAGGEHWVRFYFGVPFFGSMKPVKSDEDHFFSPTGYSLGGEFNIWGGVYFGTRYSAIEYEKYFSKGAAVSNYESNLIVSSLFTYLSYHF